MDTFYNPTVEREEGEEEESPEPEGQIEEEAHAMKYVFLSLLTGAMGSKMLMTMRISPIEMDGEVALLKNMLT